MNFVTGLKSCHPFSTNRKDVLPCFPALGATKLPWGDLIGPINFLGAYRDLFPQKWIGKQSRHSRTVFPALGTSFIWLLRDVIDLIDFLRRIWLADKSGIIFSAKQRGEAVTNLDLRARVRPPPPPTPLLAPASSGCFEMWLAHLIFCAHFDWLRNLASFSLKIRGLG